jgi:hypothetical protein
MAGLGYANMCRLEKRLISHAESGEATKAPPPKPMVATRIFSSATWCLRVARRMLRTSVLDDAGVDLDSVSSSLRKGYDEPEILRSSSR